MEEEIQKSKAGSGTVPKHVIEQWDEAKSQGSGSQAALRKIALTAVERVPGKNKYRIVVKKPLFEEWRSKKDEDFGIKQSLGSTYTFAKKEAGSHQYLMDAVERGEVTKVTDPASGVEFYQRLQYVVGKKTTTGHHVRVGGQQRITRDMAIEAQKELAELLPQA